MSELPRKPDFVLQLEFENATAYFYAYRDPLGGLRRSNLPRYNITGTDIYDSKGAMYFAVAVILIYGVSIALLIGTTLRRSNADYEVKGFLRSYARLDREKKTKDKLRMRRRLIEKNMLPVFPGCSLAAAPNIFDEQLELVAEVQPVDEASPPETAIAMDGGGEVTASGGRSSADVLSLLLGTSQLAYIDESPDNASARTSIVDEARLPPTCSPSLGTAAEQTMASLPPGGAPEAAVHGFGREEGAENSSASGSMAK